MQHHNAKYIRQPNASSIEPLRIGIDLPKGSSKHRCEGVETYEGKQRQVALYASNDKNNGRLLQRAPTLPARD